MSHVDTVVRLRDRRGFRRFAKEVLALYGIDIPASVDIGYGLELPHRAMGTVITSRARLGNRVTVYPHVTIGSTDVYTGSQCEPIIVEDDVILCVGSVVLGDVDGRVIGQGTVVGANAVLRTDTGPWEIWAENPAVKVGDRNPEVGHTDSARVAARSSRVS